MENVYFLPEWLKFIAIVAALIGIIWVWRTKSVAGRCRICCSLGSLGAVVYFFYVGIQVALIFDYSQHSMLCSVLGFVGIICLVQLYMAWRRRETWFEAGLLTVVVLITSGTFSLLCISLFESFQALLIEIVILVLALCLGVCTVRFDDEASLEKT